MVVDNNITQKVLFELDVPGLYRKKVEPDIYDLTDADSISGWEIKSSNTLYLELMFRDLEESISDENLKEMDESLQDLFDSYKE